MWPALTSLWGLTMKFTNIDGAGSLLHRASVSILWYALTLLIDDQLETQIRLRLQIIVTGGLTTKQITHDAHLFVWKRQVLVRS